jgi:hypothetical protein
MDLHPGSTFLWLHIVLYPLSVRTNFVVCPHEPLLKLQNTGLWAISGMQIVITSYPVLPC